MNIFLSNLIENGDKPADINRFRTGHIAASRPWLDDVLGFDTADLSLHETQRLRPDVYRWSLRNDKPDYHKIHDAYTCADTGEPVVSREATLGALYIIRNPLDVASSAANHWHCSIDTAIERMGRNDNALSITSKKLAAQVEQPLLTWSQHVLSWVDAPGLCCEIVRYEDMLTHPQTTFSRIAAFLNLPTEQNRVEKAVRFSDFSEVSRQERDKGFFCRPQKTELFFRQGKQGAWRTNLSSHQVARIIADHRSVMERFGYLDDLMC